MKCLYFFNESRELLEVISEPIATDYNGDSCVEVVTMDENTGRLDFIEVGKIKAIFKTKEGAIDGQSIDFGIKFPTIKKG